MTYKEFIQNILDTRGRFNCGEEYHERHHIIPKCMDGSNDKDNLIDLFAHEHFEAHRLLALENPDNYKLTYAWKSMSVLYKDSMDRYVLTPSEYEEMKKAFSIALSNKQQGQKRSDEAKMNMSKNHADVSGKNNPRYGKPVSEETRKKISEANKNPSEETRKKIGDAHRGTKHTDETKAKMSEKRRGVNHPNIVRVYCPELDEYFDYIKQATEKYNIPKTGITCCLKGKQKTAGKHPVTGQGLTWVKIESKSC